MYTKEELNDIIQTAIERIDYTSEAPQLFAPVSYTLASGGKRLRPTLVLMAANLFTDDIQPAVTPAVGLEMYHNFTLLHDDVMDKAPSRRGRPTVHVKWNDNVAILSGDAMQGLAYSMLATAPVEILKPLLDLFNRTNIEICEGQQLDMEFETRGDVTAEEYLTMIRLKTSVLLGCALKMGAIIGRQVARYSRGTSDDVEALYAIGENLGLAFQLQDDWLDCWGNPQTFGKQTGGDIMCNKKTYLLINALRMAEPDDRAVMWRELHPNTAQMPADEKVRCFTDIYTRCGAEAECRKAIDLYQQRALDLIDRLSVESRRTAALKSLAQSMTHRRV